MIILFKKYFSSSWKPILGSFLLIIIQTLSIIPVAILVKKIFDNLLRRGDVKELYVTLGIVLLLLFVNAISAIANRYLALRVVKTAVCKIRHDLIGWVLNMNLLQHSKSNPDELHTKIVHDSERIDCMLSAMLTQFIPSVLVFSGLACVLFFISPVLALSAGIVIPILLLVGKIIGRRAEAWTRIFHKDFSRFSESSRFVLEFSELIKHSASELYEFKRRGEHAVSLRDSSHRMAWLTTAYTIIQGNVALLGGLIVLFIGGIKVIDGSLGVGSLLSFYVALSFAVTYLRMATSSIAVMIDGRESLVSLQSFFDSKPIIKNGVEFSGLQDRISFKDVEYGYESDFSLGKISFDIKKGVITGLYGASGAGKSTIMHLVLGLFVPQKGAIYVDDINLNIIDGESYRLRVGVLSQNAHIFNGTIRENILYGFDKIDDELLLKISRASEVHDFIEKLPFGYDTEVGARGVRLSGGQRQRIAIARALLRNPDLLILDEPDNNLDVDTVGRILLNISQTGITTLVITHKQELKTYFANIYKLNNGEIEKI